MTKTAVVVALLFASGCAGSEFAGKFDGKFSASNQVAIETGTASIAIDSDGKIWGSGYSETRRVTLSIVGAIADGGTADITYTDASTTYTATGTMTLVAGHLTGRLGLTVGEKAIGTATFDLYKRAE